MCVCYVLLHMKYQSKLTLSAATRKTTLVSREIEILVKNEPRGWGVSPLLNISPN